MAVWPHSITITGYLLSETLFGFLCALGLLLCARASQGQSPWWAVAAGVVLGAGALTNAMLLPFGILLAGFLAWRRLMPMKVCAALAVGALLLPGAWAIRNSQLVTTPVAGSSSLDRALVNLEWGSRPDSQFAWRDSVFGDAATQARAHVVLNNVADEYGLLRTAPLKGAEAIMQRFGRHPLRFIGWYLFEKPYSLWNWGIQIGQGDIYVYPTKNAPFQTQPAWIALAAICHALNLLLMLLALGSLFFVGWKQPSFPLAVKPGRAALTSVLCLLIFVTLVYSALQTEPRYSVPFRALEILLAFTTLGGVMTRWLESRHTKNRAALTTAQIDFPD